MDRATRRAPLSVLLLCDAHRGAANTILEHVDAFRRFSRHDVAIFNPRSLRNTRALRLDEFDVVVIHYSLVVVSDHYVPLDLRGRIAAYEGLKIQYIQDDYRQVDDISTMINALGIDVLFTLVPAREVDRVWHALPNVRKVTTLAGYVSDAALRYQAPSLEARTIDVGYRGRTLPYWVGALGQEKAWIAQGFLERAAGTGLRCDIGWRESDRIYGRSWFEWLSSCRATLGTESGASITDFDGSLQRRVEDYVRRRQTTDFWEVHRELLEPYEGNVMMNVISPRIFEAAALRTALVLFPGEYSGIVEPERHYIPLRKDFSNFDEVVERLRDVRAMEAMVRRTYSEVAASGRYSLRAMVAEFDTTLDELARPRAPRGPKRRYQLARANRELQVLLHPSWRGATVVAATNQSAFARALRAVAAIRLIAGDPRVSTILVRALAGRKGRPALRTLTDDLVRLAFLRRAQTGRLNAGEVFVLESSLQGSGHELVLRSKRPAIGPKTSTSNADPLPLRRPERITWDHSAVGGWFHHGFSRNRWVTFGVGSDAVYSFDSLVQLGQTLPESLASALDPLLRQPTGDRTVRPHGLPLLFHLMRHLDNYVPKAVEVFRIVIRDAAIRRLLAFALTHRELRRSTSVGEIAGDSVKLALLARMRDGRLVPGASVVTHVDDAGRLVFSSTPRASADGAWADAASAEVRTVVWDHRAVGREVAAGNGPRFALGTEGVHEFKTVERLLELRPDLVWSVLSRR